MDPHAAAVAAEVSVYPSAAVSGAAAVAGPPALPWPAAAGPSALPWPAAVGPSAWTWPAAVDSTLGSWATHLLNRPRDLAGHCIETK